jgi:hypothetical protein
MRKLLWVISLLLAAVVAPIAHADTVYTINFTPTSGAPTGTFDYNSIADTITATVVDSAGNVFMFTNSDLTFDIFESLSPDLSTSYPGCGSGGDAAEVVAVLTGCTGPTLDWAEGFVAALPPSPSSDFFVFENGPSPTYGTPSAFVYDPAGSLPGGIVTGNFTVSTPEPSTVGLMLLGIVIVIQKRFARGLHQGS